MSYWDRIAKLYTTFVNRSYKGAYEEMVENIDKHINTTMNVLEIGAGPGNLSKMIAPLCNHLLATDYSDKMIVEAIKTLSVFDNVDVKKENIFDLNLEDKSFDCVLVANTLHIIPEPNKALLQIKRVLKDDGILIAPTFLINYKFFNNKFFTKLLALSGCSVYAKWNLDEYLNFFKINKWNIIDHKLIKSKMNIGFVVAKKQF